MSDVLFSADHHFAEPADLWTSKLPKSMHDKAPKLICEDEKIIVMSYGEAIVAYPLQSAADVVDKANPWVTTRSAGGSGHYLPNGLFAYSCPADEYVRASREEGIWGASIFPNWALALYTIPDFDFKMQCARIYNDGVHEAFYEYQDRFFPLAVIPVDEPNAAVDEIERIAEMGMKGVTLPMVPPAGKPYDLDSYDVIWASCQRLGYPLTFHGGSGQAGKPIREQGDLERSGNDMTIAAQLPVAAPTMNLVENGPVGPALIASLVYSGALERFPQLHLIVTELGGGWLAPFIDIMDHRFELAAYGMRPTRGYWKEEKEKRTSDMVAWPLPDLPLRPSEYVRRQVHVTFQNPEPATLRTLDVTGVEALCWGADFPHGDGTYPYSRDFIDEMMSEAHVTAEDRAAILGGTLAKLYGIELPPRVA